MCGKTEARKGIGIRQRVSFKVLEPRNLALSRSSRSPATANIKAMMGMKKKKNYKVGSPREKHSSKACFSSEAVVQFRNAEKPYSSHLLISVSCRVCRQKSTLDHKKSEEYKSPYRNQWFCFDFGPQIFSHFRSHYTMWRLKSLNKAPRHNVQKKMSVSIFLGRLPRN